MVIWLEQPADPALTTLEWGWNEHTVVVWEQPEDFHPWILSWQVDNLTDLGNPAFRHQEGFHHVWDALARAAVITASVLMDERLVQPNLGIPSDRRAFDALVTKFIAFTTARRESTTLPHRTRARM